MTPTPDTQPQSPATRSAPGRSTPSHSEVGFTVRHMMVSKVRGRFTEFAGTIVTAEDIADSSGHRRGRAGFHRDRQRAARRPPAVPRLLRTETRTHHDLPLDAAWKPNGDDWVLDGELTLKGVTKSRVRSASSSSASGPDAYGGYRTGFSGTDHDQPPGLRRDLEPDHRGRRRRRGRQGHHRDRGRVRPGRPGPHPATGRRGGNTAAPWSVAPRRAAVGGRSSMRTRTGMPIRSRHSRGDQFRVLHLRHVTGVGDDHDTARRAAARRSCSRRRGRPVGPCGRRPTGPGTGSSSSVSAGRSGPRSIRVAISPRVDWTNASPV